MPGCKPGDAAIVIGGPHPENIGVFVTVVQQELSQLPVVAFICDKPSRPLKTDVFMNVFGVLSWRKVRTDWSGPALFEDQDLHPIRGLPTPAPEVVEDRIPVLTDIVYDKPAFV